MKSERQRAIDRADSWFSKLIRLKHSDGKTGICYTSGTVKPVIELECGHFISRGHFTTRWHEDNARPQSTYANKWKNGQHQEFRQRLIVDIGEKRVEDLERKANQTAKFSVEEIREIADHYREKFNELVKLKDNPWK